MSEHAPSQDIFDTTAATFIADVIERSSLQTVAVDFWAPWCGPCKALAPILEQLVAHYAGRLAVARVNTDEQQAIAAQFGIRGIPDVRIFRDGRMVDGFVGVQPFSRLQPIFDRHVSGAAPAAGNGARELLAAGKLDEAIAQLTQLLEQDPANTGALVDLAEAYARAGQLTEAEEALGRLPANASTGKQVDKVRARIHFTRAAPDAHLAAELRTRLDARMDEAQVPPVQLHHVAAHELLRGDAGRGLELLLTLMKRDRRFEDGLPQRSLVQAFNLLGEQDERVAQARRKLATLLY